MAEENKKRINEILKDLKSENKVIILEAIQLLRSHGKKEAIEELIELYINTKDEDIKTQVTNFLFDLKNEVAIQPLFKAINNKKFLSINPFLISIFWQSTLDVSEHLNLLIRLAVKGDYNVCLEVLTVIENFDASFDEQDIMDALYEIEEVLDEVDENKFNLLLSLKEVVSNLKVDY